MTLECNKLYLYRNPRHGPKHQMLWLDLPFWRSAPFDTFAKICCVIWILCHQVTLGALHSLLLTPVSAVEAFVSLPEDKIVSSPRYSPVIHWSTELWIRGTQTSAPQVKLQPPTASQLQLNYITSPLVRPFPLLATYKSLFSSLNNLDFTTLQ